MKNVGLICFFIAVSLIAGCGACNKVDAQTKKNPNSIVEKLFQFNEAVRFPDPNDTTDNVGRPMLVKILCKDKNATYVWTSDVKNLGYNYDRPEGVPGRMLESITLPYSIDKDGNVVMLLKSVRLTLTVTSKQKPYPQKIWSQEITNFRCTPAHKDECFIEKGNN